MNISKPSDLNYDTIEHCDVCRSEQLGTMHHAAGATGRVCPVLWTCHYCANPPALIAEYRRLVNKARRYVSKLRYLLTTTRQERAATRAKRNALVARINARRAATGRPLIAIKGN